MAIQPRRFASGAVLHEPMSDTQTPELHPPADNGRLYTDEKYLIQEPRQIQQLMRALVEQRCLITAHPGGRDQSFPTALLDVDTAAGELVLDASPVASVNRAAAEAPYLLCFAKLDRVTVRFRLTQLRMDLSGEHMAFRADVPDEVYHLQRRELYRLETPVADSPWCQIPALEPSQTDIDTRVIDISAGGIAISQPAGSTWLALGQHHETCTLRLPDTALLSLSLQVRNIREYTPPNGLRLQRIGLQFNTVPRAVETAIQRYIFRVDRQRKARQNGDL